MDGSDHEFEPKKNSNALYRFDRAGKYERYDFTAQASGFGVKTIKHDVADRTAVSRCSWILNTQIKATKMYTRTKHQISGMNRAQRSNSWE